MTMKKSCQIFNPTVLKTSYNWEVSGRFARFARSHFLEPLIFGITTPLSAYLKGVGSTSSWLDVWYRNVRQKLTEISAEILSQWKVHQPTDLSLGPTSLVAQDYDYSGQRRLLFVQSQRRQKRKNFVLLLITPIIYFRLNYLLLLFIIISIFDLDPELLYHFGNQMETKATFLTCKTCLK